MGPEAATTVTVGDVIELVNSIAILVGILAIGFSFVGAIAVWRADRNSAWAFFRMFERLQVLQLLTVMLVIASATMLAMLGMLNSNGVTGILSGVAGYVLGGLNRGGQSSEVDASIKPAQKQTSANSSVAAIEARKSRESFDGDESPNDAG